MRPSGWGPRKRSCCESASWNHPSHRGSGEVGSKAACGNDGALESLENQRQVFHPSQRSLEISQRRRDFHIPTGPAVSPPPPNKTGGGGRTVGYGKVEIQKQDSHFPTAPTACGARKTSIKKRLRKERKGSVVRSVPITHFRLILYWNGSRFHAHPWIGKCYKTRPK